MNKMDGILRTLGGGQGYLKAGCLGFQGSGKTLTTIYLMIAARRHFELDGPLVMFDTEGGSEYIAHIVKTLTGTDLIGIRAKSFTDLVQSYEEAIGLGACGFLADSITHPWRELCDAHLKEVNAKRARRKKLCEICLFFALGVLASSAFIAFSP